MPTFDFEFDVDAPLQAVRDFHHDTNALKKLTPPPTIVQVQSVEPLGEGSVSEFTLWMGPLPIRWRAVHKNVSDNGFTDIQESGPMKRWEHTHSFTAIDANTTRIHEHIEYEHFAGPRGVFSRGLFNQAGLWFTFSYRKRVTKKALEGKS